MNNLYTFKIKPTNNAKDSTAENEALVKMLQNSKSDFNFCSKDLSSHHAVVAINAFLNSKENKETKNPELKDFALGKIQKRRLEQYIDIVKSGGTVPLLILSGSFDTGKRSLAEAVAKEFGLSIKENKDGSGEKDLVIFDTTPHKRREWVDYDDIHFVSEEALVFKSDVNNKALGILIAETPEYPIPGGYVEMEENYSNVQYPYIEIKLNTNYDTKEVTASLLRFIKEKNGLVGDISIPVVATRFHQAGIPLVPGKVDALFARAKQMSSIDRKVFDEEYLIGVIKEYGEDHPPVTRHANIIWPKTTFKDVILSGEEAKDVEILTRKARNLEKKPLPFGKEGMVDKGKLAVLLYGKPGTGKTMVSKALAGELGKPLFMSDFGKLIDSWIGATEKNLTKLFKQASSCGGVLMLDECDALITNRENGPEWKKGVVNHLLTLIENFEGILIMASNFADDLDSALERRLNMIIEVGMPNTAALAKILTSHLEGFPLSKDFNPERAVEGLGISGGYVKNAVTLIYDRLLGEEISEVTTEDMKEALIKASKSRISRGEKRKSIGFGN